MWCCALALATLSAAGQQVPINPRLPPPPPPGEPVPAPAAQPEAIDPTAAKVPEGIASRNIVREAELAPPPELPASVAIPGGTRIAVVLDTPLSTRIARPGQMVTFRTSEALHVGDQLEIPPETGFTGSVVEVRRPGHFGKPGVLRVKVDRINLATGATAEVAAKLDSPDAKGAGRLASDRNRTTDLYSLAMYTLEGTLLGSRIHGGKGAAIGAGAGASVALLIMMSRRGADLYLEPGMPFLIILDRSVELPGSEVFAAQQSYARARRFSGAAGAGDSSAGTDGSEIQRNPDGAVLDSDRPKLKRRPRNAQP